MQLRHGLHLAYCTNVHPGESWAEMRRALEQHALSVRGRVARETAPFGLGIWLGAAAARELEAPAVLAEFRAWLAKNNLYVFTLNGFPFARFHGGRVKENVYRPDWTDPVRLEHTLRLFGILAQLPAPGGTPGTVSTLPGSFKGFGLDDSAQEQMFWHLARCAARLDELRDKFGRDFALGLEPEPLGWFETTAETLAFLRKFFARPDTPRCAREVIGITYDTCHLAVEHEDAAAALGALRDAGARIVKMHFSSAVRVTPTDAGLAALARFDEPVYLHQIVARGADGALRRWADLPESLAWAKDLPAAARGKEWRVHFHIPLHAAPEPPLGDTRDHLRGTLDFLARAPDTCAHLEMETYTWAVLPEPLRAASIEEQLAAEYAWTLGELRQRGLADGKR